MCDGIDVIGVAMVASMAGLLLGRLWAGWIIWGYIADKTPDAAGWRTAFHLREKFYYIVTDHEYVEKVM